MGDLVRQQSPSALVDGAHVDQRRTRGRCRTRRRAPDRSRAACRGVRRGRARGRVAAQKPDSMKARVAGSSGRPPPRPSRNAAARPKPAARRARSIRAAERKPTAAPADPSTRRGSACARKRIAARSVASGRRPRNRRPSRAALLRAAAAAGARRRGPRAKPAPRGWRPGRHATRVRRRGSPWAAAPAGHGRLAGVADSVGSSSWLFLPRGVAAALALGVLRGVAARRPSARGRAVGVASSALESISGEAAALSPKTRQGSRIGCGHRRLDVGEAGAQQLAGSSRRRRAPFRSVRTLGGRRRRRPEQVLARLDRLRACPRCPGSWPASRVGLGDPPRRRGCRPLPAACASCRRCRACRGVRTSLGGGGGGEEAGGGGGGGGGAVEAAVAVEAEVSGPASVDHRSSQRHRARGTMRTGSVSVV